jgi:hypothetical protein
MQVLGKCHKCVGAPPPPIYLAPPPPPPPKNGRRAAADTITSAHSSIKNKGSKDLRKSETKQLTNSTGKPKPNRSFALLQR